MIGRNEHVISHNLVEAQGDECQMHQSNETGVLLRRGHDSARNSMHYTPFAV